MGEIETVVDARSVREDGGRYCLLISLRREWGADGEKREDDYESGEFHREAPAYSQSFRSHRMSGQSSGRQSQVNS